MDNYVSGLGSQSHAKQQWSLKMISFDMGPPTWPWRCGLIARPVSGSGYHSIEQLLCGQQHVDAVHKCWLLLGLFVCLSMQRRCNMPCRPTSGLWMIEDYWPGKKASHTGHILNCLTSGELRGRSLMLMIVVLSTKNALHYLLYRKHIKTDLFQSTFNKP